MRYRLGIDIGGTFTDFVLVQPEGGVRVYKVNSNPSMPAMAIAEGLAVAARDIGISPSSLVQDCDLIVHGTTVVTNALIQRKGAKTGLLCTEGFRDSFEIRQGYKEERYNFQYPPPPVLVPRYLRRPIKERITKDGAVFVPLDENQARQEIRFLKQEGVTAIAVCFLWSFLNPKHERRIGELLAEEFPDAFISLSVDVLPQIREYDRTSTTIVNAFVGPILRPYLTEIEELFAASGAEPRGRSQVRFMQTNSGFASAEFLATKPIYALNSGPAAGPIAGLFFSRQVGNQNVLTVDMGGTSFDVSLVENGQPDTVKSVDVCRYRIGIPMMNIHTIGAGGGSIASLGPGGVLRVGPESAEGTPGPVCYQRGGSEPTVTDVNLVLGYLNPMSLLAGNLRLERAAAERAIREKIADPAGLSLEEAAHGIIEVVNHNMTSGIREVTVERGYDPRDFAMVVGGGAGPIHAGRLARDLQIPLVIVPKVASVLCAFGELVADLRHDYVSSYPPTPIRSLDLGRLNQILEDLEAAGRAEVEREGVAYEDAIVTRSLELRYRGQVHECSIPISNDTIDDVSVAAIEERFHRKHLALYTYAERESICELLNVLVTVRGALTSITIPEIAGHQSDLSETIRERRLVYFSEVGGFSSVPVYDGDSIPPGTILQGPAVVEEPSTTIVVYPESWIEMDRRGFYMMKFENRD